MWPFKKIAHVVWCPEYGYLYENGKMGMDKNQVMKFPSRFKAALFSVRMQSKYDGLWEGIDIEVE